MTRYYRKSRRQRLSRTLSAVLPSLALVLVGSGGFYLAMQWFRGDADEQPALAAGLEEAGAEAAPMVAAHNAPVIDDSKTLESVAPLVSTFDGQHTGRVQSFLTKNSADMIVLAYLPALDLAADSYHVWLLKDGLADVKDMGKLAPRADGSWILNFTAGPASGIVDPRAYGSVVVTREPNDGNGSPSGNKIAEGQLAF